MESNLSLDSILTHLDNAQWWPPDILADHQFSLLKPLVAHACRTVPWYQRRFDALGLDAEHVATPECWSRVPLLTRADIQNAGQDLHSDVVPVTHGRVSNRWTSGSTAAPVMVLATELTRRFWTANTIREHRWRECNFRRKLAIIRHLPGGGAEPPDGLKFATWGLPSNCGIPDGPSAVLSIKSTTQEQAAWLQREQPAYLHSYPALIHELANHVIATGQRLPSLLQVHTHGGVVDARVRDACRRAWDVEIFDAYSSNEVGHIAVECALGSYHLQSEHLLVEILDDEGRACGPGETGRVVVTDLYNYAMPLLRYDLGDFAEPGSMCRCGRKLPTLARILGRARNMFVLPTGERRWPAIEVDAAASFAGRLPIRQFQVIQHSLSEIEVKLVADRPLLLAEEVGIRRMLTEWLTDGFLVRFTYVDSIPRDPSGKFEDFRCEIAAAG
jgi:phenylacetate-CoA ligase